MAPLLYFAQVSLYAAIMWGIYCIAWRNKPLHAYSRAYLLMALVLPVLLPVIHLPIPASGQPALAGFSAALPQVSIGAAPGVHAAKGIPWLTLLAGLYSGGSILIAVLYLRAYFRIIKRLRQGQPVRHIGYTVITDTAIGPGTVGRVIFFPSGKVDNVIVCHELAHIRAGHRFDSMLLQVMHVLFWPSPAHWLIGKELKTVHEFEADRIASEGVGPAAYVSLLLSQSFGTNQSFTITHSFFYHPLKRRIMMLQKMNAPKRAALLLTAIALTAGFMSTVLVAHSKKIPKSNNTSQSDSASIAMMEALLRKNPLSDGEIKMVGGAIAFKTVEELPAFNGSLREWMKLNLRYPESAKANGIQGRCLLQFTVDEHGKIVSPRLLRSSGNQLLDDEALRAVGSMPAWKPGMHKGAPVPVLYTLPVSFGKDIEEGC